MTRLTAIAALLVLTAASQSFAQSFGNPIVGGSDSQHITYDPFSDTTFIDNTRHRVRESAFDPDRNYADYGSRKYVDRYYTDEHGQTVHEYGWTWTTNGKPHGQLTREVVTYTPHHTHRPVYGGCPNSGGGQIRRDRDIITYSPQQGGPQGGVVNRDRDIVTFSMPNTPRRGGQPGTVQRDRDIVTFDAPSSNNNRSNSTRNNIESQIRNFINRR